LGSNPKIKFTRHSSAAEHSTEVYCHFAKNSHRGVPSANLGDEYKK